MKSFGLALLLSCSCLTAAPTIALAQDAAPAPAQDAEATGVDEVVVTARRREEKLQDVPVAVTALSSQDLSRQVVQDITDLQSSVPGLNTGAASSTGGRKSINLSLRGVRSSAVTVYSSEVLRNPQTMFDVIYDLQSIQVLKGPQGTLFGANSLSGAVLVQPQSPTFQFEGYLEGRLGNYDARGGTVVVNVPLIDDKVALRIGADFGKRDGFIKGPNFDYDADDHYSTRLSLLVRPVEALTNTTVYEYYRFQAQQGNVVPIDYFPCTATGPLAATTANSAPCLYVAARTAPLGLPTFIDAFNAEIANGPFRTNQVKSYPQNINNNAVANITSLDLGSPLGDTLGALTFRSILGYSQFNLSQRDNFGLVLDVVEQNREVVERRKTFEFQVQGEGMDGRLNWVVGAYLSRFTQGATQNSIQLGPFNAAIPITNRFNTNEKQNAGYAQASLEVVDNVTLTAGYRRTKTTTVQVNRNRNTPAQRCALSAAPNADLVRCERVDRQEATEPSYTLGVDWKFSPDSLLYFVTRRGFNAGGFNPNGFTPDTSTFGSERLTDYEIGVKHQAQIGGVRVRGDVAIFRNDYKDMQRRNIILIVNPATGTVVASNLTQNLASSRITGVEGQVEVFATDALTLRFGGSHLFEAKYTDFLLTTAAPAGSPPGTPPTITDMRSNILGQAPRLTLIAGLDYKLPVIEGFAEPRLSVNYAYTSKVASADLHLVNSTLSNNFPGNIQKGYGLVNAQLDLENLFDSQVKLSLWVKNLTDKFYFTQKTGTFGYLEGSFGEPRQYGAILSYRF